MMLYFLADSKELILNNRARSSLFLQRFRILLNIMPVYMLSLFDGQIDNYYY